MSIFKKDPKAILREIWVTALLILAIFAFRWSFVEPYKVPTGSMEPTILPGDRLVVYKANYSLKLPFTNIELAHFGEPKRGDIIVFRYPLEESIDFVKRVVGLPGDELEITDGVLKINGQELPLHDPEAGRTPPDTKPTYSGLPLQWKIEDLTGVNHWVQRIPHRPDPNTQRIKVPADHYFFVGDNRDNSSDSRYWGFVPKQNLKGRALMIWLSFDPEDSYLSVGGMPLLPAVRWDRMGNSLSKLY